MPVDDESIGLLLQAITFAASKHRDQRRKDSHASPYINHPLQVAELLWRVGQVRDPHILVAAVLHDTLEDTHTTPNELEEGFGPQVLALVQEVSDDKRLPKAVRKRLQIENASRITLPAQALKIADKICNIRDITHNPPVDWSPERKQEYLDWASQVVNGLRGANSRLEALFDQELAEGRRILQEP